MARGRRGRERGRGRAPRLVPGLPIVPRKGHLVITDRYPGFLRHQVVELGYLKSAHTLDPRVGGVQRPAAPDRPAARRLVARARGLGRLDQPPAPRPHAAPRGASTCPALARPARAAHLGRLPAGDARQPPARRDVGARPVGRRRPRGPRHHDRARHRGGSSPTSSSAGRPRSTPRRSTPAARCPPMPERVRFTLDGRPAEAEAGHEPPRRAVERGPARGAHVGGRRAARPALRHGHLLRVPRHDRRRAPPPRVPRAGPRGDGRVRRGCASRGRPSAGHGGSRSAPVRDRGASGVREVVVVGGGPAGIAAAVHAAEAGARTLLLDEQARPGGQIWRRRARPRPPARGSSAWRARERRCSRAPRSWTRRRRTSCSSSATAVRVRVGFERLVLATGARELFLPFPGWTLPGVVGVGGAQALLKAGARFDGLRVVVAGSGPLLLAVAAALKRAGARVVGIAEQAPLSRLAAFGAGLWRQPRKIAEGLGYAATLRGVALPHGHVGPRGARRREAPSRCVLVDATAGASGVGLRRPGLRLRPRAEPRAAAPPRLRDDGRRRRRGRVAADEPGRRLRGRRAVRDRGRRPRARHRRDRRPRRRRARRRRRTLARRRARETAFAGAARPRVRAAGRAARPSLAPTRSSAAARTSPLGRLAAAGSAREAKLHTRAGMGACQGRVCGAALGLPARLHARHACARRSRPFPSRCWRARKTKRYPCRHEVARRHPRDHDPLQAGLLGGRRPPGEAGGRARPRRLHRRRGPRLARRGRLALVRREEGGPAALPRGARRARAARGRRRRADHGRRDPPRRAGRRHGLRGPHGPAALRLQGRLARDARALRRRSSARRRSPACSTTTRSRTGPTSSPSRWSTSPCRCRTSWR